VAEVDACEVLDSRGRPTVWCEVTLASGAKGAAAVPSGASTGSHERCELRDGGDRYGGRGVLRAVGNVRDVLGPAVRGMDATDQRAVDAALVAADGTRNLSCLGANAVLAVSVATSIAAATARGAPLYFHLADALGTEPLLPLPMVNILSGGAHAGGCVDIQDYLVIPLEATSFAGAIEVAVAVREGTRRQATKMGHFAELAADEGGLGLALESNRAGLELLRDGIEAAGLRPGTDVAIALDIAANQIVTPAGYTLRTEERHFDAASFVDELEQWCGHYPIISIEDPLSEDDWPGWRLAAERMSGHVQLVGDDLFATDLDRLEKGVEQRAANAVLVKPNQVGTLTGASDVVRRAHSAGLATIVSARSGETEDSWLADLAVGWAAGQIKVGSTTRSERTAKWNRLLRIEHALGAAARYAGPSALAKGRPGPG
jgi:enolase